MQCIKIYEDFSYLYSCLVKELHIFDSNGNFRDRNVAEGNIEILLTLLDTLGKTTLSDTVARIRKSLPALLNYFDQAASIVDDLRQSNIDENPLKALCAGWQWHKGVVKSKKPQGDITVGIMNSFALKLQEVIFKSNMTMPKNKCIMIRIGRTKFCNGRVYQLNYSALSEYITKPDHQEMLNLIMFYHNHRRYKNGKRSNKTPYEMLTGKQQEKDWMELIFDIIDDKTPIFNDLIRLSPARQILIRW